MKFKHHNHFGDSFPYFDRADVRALLHVSPNSPLTYEPSNPNVLFAYRPQLEASDWVFDIFLAKYSQYKVLHIHANTDGLITLPGVWDLIKKRDYLKA